MPVDDIVGEREEHPLVLGLVLLPRVLLGRAPPGPAVLAHPPPGIHIRPAGEQRPKQRDPLRRRRTAIRIRQPLRRRVRLAWPNPGIGDRSRSPVRPRSAGQSRAKPLVLRFQLSYLLQRDIEHHPQLSGIIPTSSVVHPTIIGQITGLPE